MLYDRRRLFAKLIAVQSLLGVAACTGVFSPSSECRFGATFSDVTDSTNIRFQHHTGAFRLSDGDQSRYMPETMGPGVALLDYDNDGDQDIIVADSMTFPGEPAVGPAPRPRLFQNQGGLVFADVTEQAGLATNIYGMGVTTADYNGDGFVDIFLTAWGYPVLLRNAGNGTFVDVTSEAGISSRNDRQPVNAFTTEWSTGAVFFDADGDLDLDLVVINYVRWSPDSDVSITLDFKHKAYSSPRSYAGNSPRLYLQENGKFADHTDSSGIYQPDGKSLGIALWDFDNDGRLDIVVANDAMRNFAYRNLGGGRFEERAEEMGLAYDENGNERAGMGIDIADYANNGSSAVAIGNFSGESTSFFISADGKLYREHAEQTGVANATYHALTFGLVFADLDLDGWQDLLMTNGHVQPGIDQVYPDETYKQSALLLKNITGRGFRDVSACAGEALQKPVVGRGLAVGDLDGDGDLDLVLTENGNGIRILRNNVEKQSYLRIRLNGDAPNTQAIGALLEVGSGGIVQRRIVKTGSSYLSQSELVQTFGLGRSSTVDYVRVVWPNGDVEKRLNPRVNQELVFHRDKIHMRDK